MKLQNPRNSKAFFLLIIILVSTVFYNLIYFKQIKIDIDEGLIIADSERVLDSPFPYVRFSQYLPGKYYLLALFFLLFGKSIVVARIMFIFIHCINNVMAFLIAKKIMPYPFSLIPSLLLLLVPGYWHKSYVALLLLLNLYFIFRLQREFSKKNLILTSLVVGFSFYIRIDMAGYGIIVAYIAILLGAYLKNIAFSEVVVKLVVFSLSVIIFISPVFIIHGIQDDWAFPVDRIINDIKNANQQSSPFPSLGMLIAEPTQIMEKNRTIFFVYTSLLSFILILLFLYSKVKNRTFRLDIKNEYIFSTLVLALLSFNHIWPFPTHIFRMPQSGILIHVLWAFLIYQSYRLIYLKRSILAKTFLALFFCFSIIIQVYYIVFCFFGHSRIRQDAATITVSRGSHLSLKSHKGGVSPPFRQARALNRTVNFIVKNTKSEDRIFCFHEAILYFLSDRKNATNYTNMRDLLIDPKARRMLRNQLVYHYPKLIICKNVQYHFLKPYMPELFDEILEKHYRFRMLSGYRIYIRAKPKKIKRKN